MFFYKMRTAIVFVLIFFLQKCQSLSTSSSTASVIPVTTTSHTWMYQGKHPIAYDCRRGRGISVNDPPLKEEQSILLLNGFGMGTFHQHRLMDELLPENAYSANYNDNSTVISTIYAMDYLGQGKSWPVDCADGTSDAECGLQYSAQTWVDQVVHFIEDVVLRSDDHHFQTVHLVGNSLGGYLATYVAVSRPDLVASVSLLNATPVWGLRWPGWSGHLPAPLLPKAIGRFLFDRLRNPATIEQFLRTTYANPTAYDAQLIRQIRSGTEGPGGHAAFASILWSPPLEGSMYDCLERLQCDVLLLFGRDDPWCKPVFAQAMLQRLQRRRDAQRRHMYVEMTHVGHCPNHEAPRATAHVLQTWLSSSGCESTLHSPTAIQEAWGGETVVQARAAEEIRATWMDQIAVRMLL
jgi:pimeloyl-ACP methyl ester carboxylesterase